jgi:hypothetical protein
LHIRASLNGSFLRIHADRAQARDLVVREIEGLAHAGIFRHAQKARAAAKSAPAAALHAHPAPSTSTRPSLPAELAPASSLKFVLAATPLVLSAASPLVLAATHLMLTLPSASPWRGPFLSPTDNRCRQQDHKT